MRRCLSGAALQFSNSIFQLEPDPFEDLQLSLFSSRFAGVNQPVNPAMTKAQFFEI